MLIFTCMFVCVCGARHETKRRMPTIQSTIHTPTHSHTHHKQDGGGARSYKRGQWAAGLGGGPGRGDHHAMRSTAAACDTAGAAVVGRWWVLGCVCMGLVACVGAMVWSDRPLTRVCAHTHTITGSYTSVKGDEEEVEEEGEYSMEVKKCKPRILLTGSALPPGIYSSS